MKEVNTDRTKDVEKREDAPALAAQYMLCPNQPCRSRETRIVETKPKIIHECRRCGLRW